MEKYIIKFESFPALYIHNAPSPQMEALVELHDNIMFYLVIILFGVAWILLCVVVNYLYKIPKNNINNLKHFELKLNWIKIIPGFILILIAFPSFKLLYLMDEVTDPSLTVSAEGHQWYWSYQYPDFLNSDYEELDLDSYDYIHLMNESSDGSSPEGSSPSSTSGDYSPPPFSGGGDNPDDDPQEGSSNNRNGKRTRSEASFSEDEIRNTSTRYDVSSSNIGVNEDSKSPSPTNEGLSPSLLPFDQRDGTRLDNLAAISELVNTHTQSEKYFDIKASSINGHYNSVILAANRIGASPSEISSLVSDRDSLLAALSEQKTALSDDLIESSDVDYSE